MERGRDVTNSEPGPENAQRAVDTSQPEPLLVPPDDGGAAEEGASEAEETVEEPAEEPVPVSP